MRLEWMEGKSPIAPLVAEIDGKVVGFIIGFASGWEYGVPEDIGWIYDIGVDPEYQRKGIARILVNVLIKHLQKVGVQKIYTLVNWRSWDMLQFFDAIGFTKGDMVNLELDLR